MTNPKPLFTTDYFENGSSEPGFTTTTQAALDANAKVAPLQAELEALRKLCNHNHEVAQRMELKVLAYETANDEHKAEIERLREALQIIAMPKAEYNAQVLKHHELAIVFLSMR